MPIESICPGCGRRLQLADEHLGKQARCPACGTISTILQGSPGEDIGPPGTSSVQWLLRTPEDQTYGPVSRNELDTWVSEGRVGEDCYLRTEEQEDWVQAAEIYPVLKFHPLQVREFRVATPDSVAATVAAPPRHPATRDRGPLVLALGILGFGVPLFGLIAWLIGASDLRQMRAGRLDPRGIGATHAGHVLGLVSVAMWIVGALVGGIIAVFALAVGV